MKTHTHNFVATWPNVATTCDLCQALIVPNARNDVGEATVRLVTGLASGDEDDTTTVEADVCGRCFRARVQPALEAVGVMFHGYFTARGRDGIPARTVVTAPKKEMP